MPPEAGCPRQGVPDVTHAAGGDHEDAGGVRESELLREYFSSLIQWFFEMQLIHNCPEQPCREGSQSALASPANAGIT